MFGKDHQYGILKGNGIDQQIQKKNEQKKETKEKFGKIVEPYWWELKMSQSSKSKVLEQRP